MDPAAPHPVGLAAADTSRPWTWPPGDSFAIMYIPSLGKTWAKAVVQGVTLDDLRGTIGHYPKSQMPGEIGNFAVAGHRATNGEPFRNIPDVKVGDKVYVETEDTWYVYTVGSTEIVEAHRRRGHPARAEQAGRHTDRGADHPDDVQPALGVVRALDHLRRPHRDPPEVRRPSARAPPEEGLTPVYSALWRRLPGGWPLKSLVCLLLAAVVVTLLFTVVFPWAEPRLPFTDVTVEDSGP